LRARRAAVLFVFGGLACSAASSCSSESKLRKDGVTPYVRCLAGPEPDTRSDRIGRLTLKVDARVLTVAGPTPLRLAVFSASGLGQGPTEAALGVLRSLRPDLILMLGGVGADDPLVSATLGKLANLPVPTLFVLGGRDGWAVHEEALEAFEDKPGIIDATALRAIRIGNNTLVPLAGADTGRYALDAASCGFNSSDLDLVAQELGPLAADERRWLVSWHAPAELPSGLIGDQPGASSPGSAAGSSGSTAVARFAERIAARGILYAWPAEPPQGAPLPGAASHGPIGVTAVPRLFGPRQEAANMTRGEHSVLLLEVDRAGLRIAP